MKIGIFDNLPDGGAKRVVVEQVLGLSSRGHEVSYFHTQPDSVFLQRLHDCEVNNFVTSAQSHSGFGRLIDEISLYSTHKYMTKVAIEWFREHNVEVLLVHPDRYFQAPMILRYSKIPKVYYAEEWLRIVYEPELAPLSQISIHKRWYEFFRRKYITIMDRKHVRGSDMVLANSHFTALNLKKAYKVDAIPVYPGIDALTFFPTQTKKKDYFLFVGSKVLENGYDLVHTLDTQDGFPFHIKVVDIIEGTLRYSDKQMADLYRGAAGTLCLSHNEPFGLTVIESMACGTPVIAVNEGGYMETVEDGKNGILIKRSASDLAEAMMKIASNKEFAHTLSRNAIIHAQKFSWKYHIDAIEKYLEMILA